MRIREIIALANFACSTVPKLHKLIKGHTYTSFVYTHICDQYRLHPSPFGWGGGHIIGDSGHSDDKGKFLFTDI